MFILEGKNPVPCNNVVEWGKWFETADRNVAKSGDKERVHISTVFLGLDHSFSTGAVPLLNLIMWISTPDKPHHQLVGWK